MDYAGVQAFIQASRVVRSEAELRSLMLDITKELGFQRFALAHHSNARPGEIVRLTNYPDSWRETYTASRLFDVDPIHLASKRKSAAFEWSEVEQLIRLTPEHRDMLRHCATHGIVNGYTIPVHIPGDATGSCTFVVDEHHGLPHENLPIAHMIGSYAFEAARRYVRAKTDTKAAPRLTQRQLDCIILVAKGKTDWEIAKILGLSEDTVSEHIDGARERFDLARRTELVVRALYDGQITFLDVVH